MASNNKGWLKKILLSLMVLLLLAAAAVYWIFRSSLPELTGELTSADLTGPVVIQRDQQGLATISGENRDDLAYATGFVHAQERFFQMDLMRRRAAGELSEILGKVTLNVDKNARVHRFRARAKKFIAQFSNTDRALLAAYTKGVNAGLKKLSSKPFEYYLLGSEPQPWHAEDSLLVSYSMYFTLQYGNAANEWQAYLLEKTLPESLSRFLLYQRSEWDVPLEQDVTPYQPMLLPKLQDLSFKEKPAKKNLQALKNSENDPWGIIGSNNWSMSGQMTKSGAAMLANDMHLGIRVPNTWFRLRLLLTKSSSSIPNLASTPASTPASTMDVSGVSLPGTPLIVVGSNTFVAWGFTNTSADWGDLVKLKLNPENEQQYLSVNGYRNFEIFDEPIKIKGEKAADFKVRETIWGPVVDGPSDELMAYKWVAHYIQGANLGLAKMEKVKSVVEAAALADQMGMPAQNAMLVDRFGNIGWTVFGAIPRRIYDDSFSENQYQRPQDWSTGQMGWDGWLTTAEYPKVINPVDYRLWTANNRVVSGHDLKIMGDGRFGHAARAKQIRDDLFALKSDVEEKDFLAIQLDDRAIFLTRWQQLLQQLLRGTDNQKLKPYLDYVSHWGAKAAVDSVGYRLVKEFRLAVFRDILARVSKPCTDKYKKCNIYRASRQLENPIWAIVSGRDKSWLSEGFSNWNDYLESRAIAAFDKTLNGKQPLSSYTWGDSSRLNIVHPLSRFVPGLGYLTDMPHETMQGDRDMPNVAGRSFGASERLVVSPGHEQQGILHMPTSQAGNPLTPYYGVGHEDWVKGVATPLLPGKTRWKLVLKPVN